MKVHVAELILEDNWNYGLDAAYGILGYGSGSPFWEGYTDTSGNAYYSIVLAQNDTDSDEEDFETGDVSSSS
jgi:hypothetical protein